MSCFPTDCYLLGRRGIEGGGGQRGGAFGTLSPDGSLGGLALNQA